MSDTLDKYAAGDLLKKRREERGLTQEQVVENTTVPVAAYLSELENGKVHVGRSKHFPSLASFLRLSDDDIKSINPAAVIESSKFYSNKVIYSTYMPFSEEAARDTFMYYAEKISRNNEEVKIVSVVPDEDEEDFIGKIIYVTGLIGKKEHIVEVEFFKPKKPLIVEDAEGANALKIRDNLASNDPLSLHPRPLPSGLKSAIEVYGVRFKELHDHEWQQYLAGFKWRYGYPEEPEDWLDLYRNLSRAGIMPQ